ncbi:MAG: TetR/AcrR family transcriptional regulator [Actinomycetota bacterium]
MPRPQLTEEAVARTRSELLDSAQRLFERGGSEAMSFRALATEAGCSHAKPYSYFENKADLIDQLRIRAYLWMRDVIAFAAADAADPLTALQRLADAYVQAATERPRMYELLYTDQGAMDEAAEPLIDAKLACIGVCEQVIAAAADEATAPLATDPLTAAHLFWSAAHGMVSLHNDGFFVVDRSLDELRAPLFAALTTGLTSTREA